jgi:hypothetical protein
MADPLSIAASIAGVISAGLKIATELNAIVETVRDAPKELSYVAQQIEHISELLGFTFQLIEDNESLYRPRLVFMLRDMAVQDRPGRREEVRLWQQKAVTAEVALQIQASRRTDAKVGGAEDHDDAGAEDLKNQCIPLSANVS